MDKDIIEIKNSIKQKRNSINKKVKKVNISFNVIHYVNKILFTAVLVVITLITLKSNEKIRLEFYKKVYDQNISFITINKLYQKYFGSPLPFQNWFKDKTQTVFNEKLKYQEISLYKDGAKLIVDTSYLVPTLETGMVVFMGEKEDYGNTIIVEQTDGVCTWYGNIKNTSLKLYDYIEKGSLIGEVNTNELYLVFKKEGKNISYVDYLKEN